MKNSELSQIRTAYLAKDNLANNHQVNYNQFWQKMHQDYDIGKPLGKFLILVESDYKTLKDLHDRYSKTPIEQKVDTHTHRLAMSANRKNEKDSQWSVFGELLAFVSQSTLPMIQQNKIVNLPIGFAGVVMTARLEAIATDNIKQVLVLENGSMLSYFDAWCIKLPNVWQNAICVYRGHGVNQKLVKQFLAKLPKDCQIGLFMDFDIFGISLIEQYLPYCQNKSVTLLLPPNWQSMTSEHEDNQLELFIKQSQNSPNITHPQLKELQKLLINNQFAITQENVYHWDGLGLVSLQSD